MDVERDPADVTSNNGKPLVPISDQQPSRTLSQRKAEPTKPRRSPAQSNPAQSAPTYCGDTMKYYDARETRDPAAREQELLAYKQWEPTCSVTAYLLSPIGKKFDLT